jgi:hypothetical protein
LIDLHRHFPFIQSLELIKKNINVSVTFFFKDCLGLMYVVYTTFSQSVKFCWEFIWCITAKGDENALYCPDKVRDQLKNLFKGTVLWEQRCVEENCINQP